MRRWWRWSHSLPMIGVFFFSGCLGCLAADPDRVVQIEPNRPLKVLAPGAAGVNLCWLMDSDQNTKRQTSMQQALREMGVGALRFPYGHLADYYLWHSGPYAGIANSGLKPRMVHPLVDKWEWAFRPDGSMPGAMDFDEFIALCQSLGARPLVVVPVLTQFVDRPERPSRADLIQNAADWVRYAKTKAYPVAYWAIGNEVDHKPTRKHLSREAYFSLYVEMVQAMKAVDPTIRTGPGILGSASYFEAALAQDPALVDFTCVHQYQFKYRERWRDDPIAKWRSEVSWDGWSNLGKAKNIHKKARRPNLEVLVTEMGITGGPSSAGTRNDLFKALWFFELQMATLYQPGVRHTFFWGTHNPWQGNGEPAADLSVLLHAETNERKPTGEIIRMVNTLLYRQLLEVPRVNGMLRVFATRDADTGRLAIAVLNKGSQEDEFAFRAVNGVKEPYKCRVFEGKSLSDTAPTLRDLPIVPTQSDPDHVIRVTCPGEAILFLRQEG